MLQNTFLAATLSFIFFTSAAPAAQTSVDLALEAIGSGSAAEMKSRIFSRPITILGKEQCQRAIQSLPSSITEHRITTGKLWRRVDALTKPILELHHRTGRIELFLYEGKFPTGMLFRECVLVLSDSLAGSLEDGELSGVIAHEMAHPYFSSEMLAAHQAKDIAAMKIVELKCDAVAMITLKLLGYNPLINMKGLERIAILTQHSDHDANDCAHPRLGERQRFARSFVKAIEG